MKFVGRQKEIALLKKNLAKENGQAKIIVLKGRRRVGKSTLIQHLLTSLGLTFYKIIGMPPAKVNRTTTELSNFAQQLSEQFNIQKPAFADWDEAISTLSDLVKDGNCVLFIDEINWLGKTHEDITAVLFTAWESKLKHNKGLTLILTGSLVGWILEHLSESEGWCGRISLDETLMPLPLADALDIAPPNVKKRMTAAEHLRFISVVGGIPSYLDAFDYQDTLEQNLQRLAYTKSGALFREYDVLMKDLFRAKGKRINVILELLSTTNLSANEIAIKLGYDKPNGELYSDLVMMINAAFISTVHRWDLHNSVQDERAPTYVISDPYLRFYHKAIKPHLARIKRGNSSLPNNVDSILGLQFEYIMRNNVSLVHSALNLSLKDIINEAPYQTKGLQVDWLIETSRCFYLVEYKFSAKPLERNVIRDMHKKVINIDVPTHKSIKTAIVHVNGVVPAVEQSGEFDYCIHLPSLLGDNR